MAEQKLQFSRATRQNTCYHLAVGEQPCSYNDNEDRVLVVQSDEEHFKTIAIFDGHEGTSAVDYVYNCFKGFLRSEQWYRVLETKNEADIKLKLEEFFRLADIKLFDSLKLNPATDIQVKCTCVKVKNTI